VDTNSVLSAVDFFPILSKVAGAKLPDGFALDGEDLGDAFFGKAVMRSKPLFWEYGRNTNSFGYPGIARNRSPNVALREGDWKLLINADGTGAELYRLPTDSSESHDVAAGHRDLVDRLSSAALAWRNSLP
jgi:arylsulfatase A-like enzyme